MSKGVIVKYEFHDCVICGKTVPVEYINSYGSLETLPPCLYNKKKTCGSACRGELIRQIRTGSVRTKTRRPEHTQKGKILTYQYTLTSMDLYLRGNYLR